MSSNEYANIDKRVSVWIEGKHARIGLIVPDKKPTPEELEDLYTTIAEVLLKNALQNREAAPK